MDLKIGDWSFEKNLNRLSRHDKTTQLEPNFAKLLLLLAKNAGRVLERDYLLEEVWGDISIEEHSLNRAISGLRKALNDDPRNPVYIETIRKKGYRLIAPVTNIPEARIDLEATVAGRTGFEYLRSKILVSAAVALAAVVAVGWFAQLGKQRDLEIQPPVPVTSLEGYELDPAFSPGSSPKQVAFSWEGKTADNIDLYVKDVGSEHLIRLTDHPAPERKPSWSPDGKSIAFVRNSRQNCGIFVINVSDRMERKLIDCDGRRIESVDWSPDGESISYSQRKDLRQPYRIALLNTRDSSDISNLTDPKKEFLGDQSPVFSPNGDAIAFVRILATGEQDIYVASVESRKARRITFDNRKIHGLDWTQDGKKIVFSSNRKGVFTLWRIPADGGQPTWISVGGEGAQYPSISHDKLVYEKSERNTDIWSYDLKGSAEKKPLITSTRADSSPGYSPDGRSIAFISNRTGSPMIWVIGLRRGKREICRRCKPHTWN